MELRLKLDLNPIFIKDKKIGGFTSYFENYPGAVGDGDTKSESLKSLTNAFITMLLNEPDFLKQAVESNPDNLTVDQNHLNLECA